MTKSKNNANIQGYFFMSINNGELDVNMAGDTDVLSAAFATLILDNNKDGKETRNMLAVAVGISAHELNRQKEKYTSKTAKKVVKTPKKSVNKK
jgi:hypothetical protein